MAGASTFVPDFVIKGYFQVPEEFTQELLAALNLSMADAQSWALGWARVAPSMLLIPAFGLRAVPVPTRIALGLALALGVIPAGSPVLAGAPFGARLILEGLRGLPVAITGATALWVASMAGGLVDDLRGSQLTVALPNVESSATPSGALLSMLTALLFLQTGGAERVASALARDVEPTRIVVARVIATLASGIELAVAVAAPLVAVALVVEVASALFARAANPAFILPILAPLRSLAILLALALLLERMVVFLADAAQVWP